MKDYVITEEFRRVFQANDALAQERTRHQRSGRLDGGLLPGHFASGSMNVFSTRPFTNPGTATGSLAIATSLQDLHNLNYDSSKEQNVLYSQTMRAFANAAKDLKLPCKIFASNMGDGNEAGKKYGKDVDLRTYDDVEVLLKDRGMNSWTRQREAIMAAEDWHTTIKAGTKLTLLVTMWPEMRDARDNQDLDKYKKFLEKTGKETAKWTRHSHFYAVGIQLAETVKNTWGNYKSYGVDNHFRECFPSASRYDIKNIQDAGTAIKSLAQRMGNVAR